MSQPSSPLLDNERLSELQEKNRARRERKIRIAGKVAAFNGWTLGIAAAFALLFGFQSLTSLGIGVGLAAAARNEFRGRKLLLRLDPRGPRLLGWNQAGLLGLIVAYCLWMLVRGVSQLDAQLEQLISAFGLSRDLLLQALRFTYTAVIGLSILFQGANAWFYFRRIQDVKDELSDARVAE